MGGGKTIKRSAQDVKKEADAKLRMGTARAGAAADPVSALMMETYGALGARHALKF